MDFISFAEDDIYGSRHVSDPYDSFCVKTRRRKESQNPLWYGSSNNKVSVQFPMVSCFVPIPLWGLSTLGGLLGWTPPPSSHLPSRYRSVPGTQP